MAPRLKSVLAALAAVAAIVGIVWYLWWALTDLGEVDLGFNGWLAMGLGVVVTLALGLGLMRLVYLSNRRGYDARASEQPDRKAKPSNPRADI